MWQQKQAETCSACEKVFAADLTAMKAVAHVRIYEAQDRHTLVVRDGLQMMSNEKMAVILQLARRGRKY